MYAYIYICLDFPGGSDSKESACNVGDLGSIPGLGSSPGGKQGNPLQDYCLENSMNGGAWRASRVRYDPMGSQRVGYY